MKYIKLFEEISNVSNVRNWPTLKHYNGSDIYFVYDLPKKDLGKYLNTWFKGEFNIGKGGVIYTDEMITLKKTDDDTSKHLYREEYNPLSIRIMCPSGAKFKKDINGNELYNMKAQIHSIDDSSYGIWWDDVELEELRDIRLQLMAWVNKYSEINGELFLDKCIELGANEESKDYN